MDISWISTDISKPGVKIWHLKSPVINIGLLRYAEVTVWMWEAFLVFLVLMHKKTHRYTFHQLIQMAVSFFCLPHSHKCTLLPTSIPTPSPSQEVLKPEVHYLSHSPGFMHSSSPQRSVSRSFIVEPHTRNGFYKTKRNCLI